MTSVVEGALTFSFVADCEAGKYDEWSFYRNRFQKVAGGSKAVDILCLEGRTAWLIEVKDYRRYARTKALDLADEVAQKVRDTLAGLAAAGKVANSDDEERRLAQRALNMRRWRVVLYLEQQAPGHRLWPEAIDSADVLSKLRKALKAIDAHPAVTDTDKPGSTFPWSVR